MKLTLRIDDLRGAAIAALLEAHLAFARSQSPPESVHAFDVERLRAPDVTFWSAWAGDQLVGCAALKELSREHGEVKSMHVAAAHRGRGVGRRLVEHLLEVARERGYRRLSLETGTEDGFTAARALYESFGFAPCAPFGQYRDDPHGLCMTLDLSPDGSAAGE